MATPNRYYSATAVRTQLTAPITASSTVITVTAITGFPSSTPFTLVIDPNLVTEEVLTVTDISGLRLSVARGQDGTNALPHDIGAKVMHALTARDLREPQEHIAAVSGVHGIVGKVVGDTDKQGLTNKTINASLNTIINIPKSAVPTDTIYTNADAKLGSIKTDGTTVGAAGATTQGVVNWFYKNPNNGRQYERRDYIYSGATESGAAIVVYDNDVETSRLSLTPAGKVQVRSSPTADLQDLVIQNDTGWVNFPAGSGWTGSRRFRKVNGVVWATFGYTRDAGQATVSGDALVITVPTGFRPTGLGFFYPGLLWVYSPGGAAPFRATLDAAFDLRIENTTIAAGGTVAGTLCWPV